MMSGLRKREEDGERERGTQRALWRGDATATPPQLLAEVSRTMKGSRENREEERRKRPRIGRAYSRRTDR
jgi:hypothetical protein